MAIPIRMQEVWLKNHVAVGPRIGVRAVWRENHKTTEKPVRIREVWQENLEKEFRIIQSVLGQYPNVSMDIEFPGVVYQSDKHYSLLSPSECYLMMKKNVDALKIIQFGLTLSDAQGNLPNLGTEFCYVWEFNFQDFDVDNDLHNPESIDLLKRQGIDFLKNKQKGIRSPQFAKLFMLSGLSFRLDPLWLDRNRRTLVTFHGTYDFGFLIKILIQRELPHNLSDFMMLIRVHFGITVYDMKQMIGFCGLYGGLEQVATSLKIKRMAGKSHQAGSDSLLTMQAFMELRKSYFNGQRMVLLNKFNYILTGLTKVC
ncbi:probable CCR4-associated factor 1 homolog 9 [Olea europaea subsp. europaea]|uniref:poly(A)-specific ribonuclease n=1 Tax=Olea europaea subsp. europaea TaxID=158383 RepID=A0A8S0T393_OLEEU|nr:probable CCR4-associated factor 1 homolog 9 [Olea europaea subsp. europaea]